MSYVKSLQILSPAIKGVKLVEDLSDHITARARVHFENGYQLSVISGYGAYTSNDAQYEIAIFDPSGNWSPQLFDDYNEGDDDVLGHQTEQGVTRYMNKIGSLGG